MDETTEFEEAQRRLLDRTNVDAESRFIDVPSVSGRAHVLTCGSGPDVIMVPGFGDPAVMWAPLMSAIDGFTLHAVDRPSFGLTSPAEHETATLRDLAVNFLEQVLDALDLKQAPFIANSMGSLWTFWLAMDRPERVSVMSHIGCPAFLLGTSAPLPMRLMAVRPIGKLLMELSPPSSDQVDRFANMAGVDLSDLPELRDVLVSAQRLPNVRPAILDLLHATMTLRGPRSRFVITEDQLRKIDHPTQFIWGETDVFGGLVIGRQASNFMPRAEFHIIRDDGHIPWIVHPEQVGIRVESFLGAGEPTLKRVG